MTTDTPDVLALREALVEKLSSDWDMDPWGEYEASKRRLEADLDALIAAVRAEALAGSGVRPRDDERCVEVLRNGDLCDRLENDDHMHGGHVGCHDFRPPIYPATPPTPATTAEITVPIDLLRSIQWYQAYSNSNPSCPACGSMHHWGHTRECWLAKLVGGRTEPTE